VSHIAERRDPPARGAASAWWLAGRPKTLPAAAAPVVLGSAAAASLGGFRAGPAAAALCGALLIQVGTNLANDVYDFERGTDTAERLGPTRVTEAGLLAPRQVRAGMAVAFGLAALAGIYLAWVAGWPVIAIGLTSIAAGLAYSSGPFPLAHHGLGEPFVMIFFGFVAVGGTAFVQLGTVPAAAWWCGLGAGALSTAILVVNNVRDAETDRRAGRSTLPARFGRRAGVAEYGVFLALAYLAPAGLVLAAGAPRGCWLSYLTLPLALALLRRVATRTDGPALNGALAGTGGLLVLYAGLLSIGLLS
jgi:1,4-dihydroxy-2-naphthoate octaprenyltransferase